MPNVITTQPSGGVLSLLALIVGAVFFGLATFTIAVSGIPLVAAGLFCCAIAWVLERFGA